MASSSGVVRALNGLELKMKMLRMDPRWQMRCLMKCKPEESERKKALLLVEGFWC